MRPLRSESNSNRCCPVVWFSSVVLSAPSISMPAPAQRLRKREQKPDRPSRQQSGGGIRGEESRTYVTGGLVCAGGGGILRGLAPECSVAHPSARRFSSRLRRVLRSVFLFSAIPAICSRSRSAEANAPTVFQNHRIHLLRRLLPGRPARCVRHSYSGE